MADLQQIEIGSKGAAVVRWQYFLIGQGDYHGKADGDFGPRTKEATIAFQLRQGLNADGVVGNKSYGAAMLLGFGAVKDPQNGRDSLNWPPRPGFKPLISDDAKRRLFGNFSYVHAPLKGDPEHIRITDGWEQKNMMNVPIPQLKKLLGGRIYFHKSAANQLTKLWADWEAAGLLHLILTWDGSFNPRFIRGKPGVLSQHAFGTAFDINYVWNKLGAVPALTGQKGSVRELVEIANNNGFYWGGHFSRLDGMHFEIARLL